MGAGTARVIDATAVFLRRQEPRAKIVAFLILGSCGRRSTSAYRASLRLVSAATQLARSMALPSGSRASR